MIRSDARSHVSCLSHRNLRRAPLSTNFSRGRTLMSNAAVPVRVLIVDDNTDFANSMCHLLAHYGFHVATASNGRRGLATARSFRPHVIILDICLPDMDGYQLAATLREEFRLEAGLLIAISAFERDRLLPINREAEFDHYLIKPVELDRLLPVLASIGQTPS
jgi:DNA-binding response OmpR family regulator